MSEVTACGSRLVVLQQNSVCIIAVLAQTLCLFLFVNPTARAVDLPLLFHSQTQPAQSNARRDAQKTVALERGNPIEEKLTGGEKHGYTLMLGANTYARVVVEQRGIDVIVRSLGPKGELLARYDSELMPQGEEKIELVSEAAGNYGLTVEAKYKGQKPGGYEIRVVEVRGATESDKELEKARRLFASAEQLYEMQKGAEAIAKFEEALNIRQKLLGPNTLAVAECLNKLGEIYSGQRATMKAAEMLQRALDISQEVLGSENPIVARILTTLARNHKRIHDDEAAMKLLDQALPILEATVGPEDAEVANTLRVQNLVHPDEARLLRELKIMQRMLGEDDPRTGETIVMLALFYTKSGEPGKAQSLYEDSIASIDRIPGSDISYTLLLNCGTFYFRLGFYSKAEATFLRVLEILNQKKRMRDAGAAITLRELARIYRVQGDYSKAQSLDQRSLALWDKLAEANDPNFLINLKFLIQFYAGVDKIQEAIRFQSRYNKNNERIASTNLEAGSERQKRDFLKTLSEEVDRSISLHVDFAPNEASARELAITTILQQKGRLQDVMADSLAALRRRLGPQDKAVLDQLSAKASELSNLTLEKPGEMTSVEYEKRIEDLERQKEELEAKISALSAGYFEKAKPVTLTSIQSAIPANAALIEFVVYRPFRPTAKTSEELYGEPRYVVYVIRNQGEVRWKELGTTKEIDTTIEKLRQSFRDPSHSDYRKLARGVDETVMAPIRPLLGNATQLLLSPDGDLNLIPFGALVDEQDRFLIQRYSFSYLTSGRDLLRLQISRQSKTQPLILADPSFGGSENEQASRRNSSVTQVSANGRRRNLVTGIDLSQIHFTQLSGTAREARAIQTIFPESSVLTGAQATESALKQAAAPRILHIATHGFFLGEPNADNEHITTSLSSPGLNIENLLLRSGLALTGANLRKESNDDGIVTALEASGLDLWGTKLVVLSACDTGIGEVRDGEGVYGLRRAFVLAGAESLVMSLWPVSDYSTQRLMKSYYGNLKRGLGRGEALRQVQLAMLTTNQKLHPFYWANFIQFGEWANLDGRR